MGRGKKFSLPEMFNDLRADFRAGTESRFVSRLKGVSPMGSGADYHYRVEAKWLHMLERCRSYQRDDQIVGQAVRRVVANIVQDGFRLDPQTGDEALDLEIKAQWHDWSTSPDMCHSEGEMCFADMEAMALSSVLVDGDVFCLPLKGGSLQWVEAHRCRTPRNTRKNVVHGVLLEETSARRLEYWFTKQELGLNESLSRVSDIRSYPARDTQTGERQVYHLYMPYRFSQRRGVSVLAPVSDTIGQHDDVQFATLVRSQMASLIAIFHERGASWEPGSDQQKGDRTTDQIGGYTRTIEGVNAGLEVFGDKDEKLSMDAARVPAPEFFPHSMLLLTFIAVNLDLPVHVLLLDPSKTNFSGWRGAIDQARLRFRQIQEWFVRKFHTPIYRWWLSQLAVRPGHEMLRARIVANDSNIFFHRWNPPQFPYIEPFKDTQTDDLQQSSCLNSRRRIQAARGRDWDEVSAEIVADNSLLIERAIEAAAIINRKYTTAGVDWREIVQPPGAEKVMPAPQGGSRPSQQVPDDVEEEEEQEEESNAKYAGRLGERLNGHNQLAGVSR